MRNLVRYGLNLVRLGQERTVDCIEIPRMVICWRTFEATERTLVCDLSLLIKIPRIDTNEVGEYFRAAANEKKGR